MKQASGIQKTEKAVDVELKKLYILRIGMDKVDQTELDGKNLTFIIVDISKRDGDYKFSAKNGFYLKNTPNM